MIQWAGAWVCQRVRGLFDREPSVWCFVFVLSTMDVVRLGIGQLGLGCCCQFFAFALSVIDLGGLLD